MGEKSKSEENSKKSSTVHYLLFIKMLYNNSRLNDGWAIKAFHFIHGHPYVHIHYFLPNSLSTVIFKKNVCTKEIKRNYKENIFSSKTNLRGQG